MKRFRWRDRPPCGMKAAVLISDDTTHATKPGHTIEQIETLVRDDTRPMSAAEANRAEFAGLAELNSRHREIYPKKGSAA